MRVLRQLATNGLGVGARNRLRDRPWTRNRTLIDRADRADFGRGAAGEDLIGDVQVTARKVVDADVIAEIASDRHHAVPPERTMGPHLRERPHPAVPRRLPPGEPPDGRGSGRHGQRGLTRDLGFLVGRDHPGGNPAARPRDPSLVALVRPLVQSANQIRNRDVELGGVDHRRVEQERANILLDGFRLALGHAEQHLERNTRAQTALLH